MDHLGTDALNAALTHIRSAPTDWGSLSLIVRRPAKGEREVLDVGELHLDYGLVGDMWSTRSSSRTTDGSPHPDMQLNVMSARVIELIAQDPQRWQLAGDQLYVDLDLSESNLPPGSRLAVGTAVIEITEQPHTGCAQFTRRFGLDAKRWTATPVGRQLRLRGLCARVVQAGTVTVGDSVAKVSPS